MDRTKAIKKIKYHTVRDDIFIGMRIEEVMK